MALERLVIRNFAVSRDVTIEPAPGLNVFTGETGAGKSLVVDALAFAFGARRGREVVAHGAERASVAVTLTLDAHRQTIERVVGLSGRSTARIDGGQATLEQLATLAETMVDIHGQSEQLSLLRPGVQLAALDEFADLASMRGELARLIRELRDVRRAIQELDTDARQRERLIDQLRFELEEIDAAALEPGEDERLRADHARLSNAGMLLQDVEAATEGLQGSGLDAAVAAIHDIARRDPSSSLADLAALLESTVDDLARELRRYRDTLEDDPARREAVGERLDLIARLRRKYGDTVEAILAYGREAGARLEALTGTEGSLEELRARETRLVAVAATLAAQISHARRGAASSLVAATLAELEHLAMPGAALAIGFTCSDAEGGLPVALPDYELVDAATNAEGRAAGDAHPRAFTEAGVDRVEFLASFNPGQQPRPLATVASGGEISRFLLALTTVLGAAAPPRIVVLDEVDEGVGGRAGAMVGEALRRLAGRHQVLCVTHLPQVAAYADRHFVVDKQTDGKATWSQVRQVTGEARVHELAAMLGGDTAINQQAARELLDSALTPKP